MTTPDAVIVTGASTGIGQAMVETFAANGIRVFAAVRDLSTVAEHPLVTPVRLDVTSAQEALDAAEVVGQALGDETRLRGIVNNAGIAVGGPMEFLDLDELRRQLEVNVIGQLAVTQAFLPLLREHGKGRIVFTSSIAGRIAAPFIGPYAASKHALNGHGRVMAPRAQAVGHRRLGARAGDGGDPDLGQGRRRHRRHRRQAPAPRRRALRRRHRRRCARSPRTRAHGGIPASKVAEAAHHAVFARRAKAEYLVGTEAKMIATASSLLPYRTFDKAVPEADARLLRQWQA